MGYIKAIGKNARRTIYNPNPRIKARWKRDLHYLIRVRDRAYFVLHPAPRVSSVSGYTARCGYSCVSCETGGTFDPQIVSPGGTYWGWYQFDYGTWIAHGGIPSHYGHASSGEQTVVASRIQYDAWPNC